MSNCRDNSRQFSLDTTFGRFNSNRGPVSRMASYWPQPKPPASPFLLTGDQNLEFQQNLRKRQLGVVVLCAASNAIEDLLPLVPDTLKAIESIQPGQVVRVRA